MAFPSFKRPRQNDSSCANAGAKELAQSRDGSLRASDNSFQDNPAVKPGITQTNCFTFEESTAYVQENLRKALSAAEKLPQNCSVFDILEDYLLEISVYALRADMALRKPFEYIPAEDYPRIAQQTLQRTKDSFSALTDNICTTSRPEHALFSVRLPAFLPGSRGEWYSVRRKRQSGAYSSIVDKELYRVTKNAIKADIGKYGPVDIPSGTVFLVFRRHLPPTVRPGRVAYVDNDNVEARVVANAICETLGKGDNFTSMGFLYLAVPTEDTPYVEVILCEASDIRFWAVPYRD